MPASTRAALAALGDEIAVEDIAAFSVLGGAQAVLRGREGHMGDSDPSKNGKAAGF